MVISETCEELKDLLGKFDKKIADREQSISQLKREGADLEAKRKITSDKVTEQIIGLSKLQSEADVSLLFSERYIFQGKVILCKSQVHTF